MKSEEWLKMYIDSIEKRFDKVDEKLDLLIQFKWRIAGGIFVVSSVVTFAVQVSFSLLNK